MANKSKTVLITGATAGIGRVTALHLVRQGHHVIATGRRLPELEALAREARDAGPGALDPVQLDVTSPASIAAAVTAVEALVGAQGLDVLINNAGFGVLGPSIEIGDAELRRQFETNVFGLMNVVRAFVPAMRARRRGRIINVSSVGGRLTLPYFGVYNASKYALESLSDALRYELRPFGIDVSLIEPGVIRTNFEATAVSNLDAYRATAYGPAMDRYEQMSALADKTASNPDVVARAIGRAVAARRPVARYVTPWRTNVMIWFHAIAPTAMWDWVMRKMAYLDPRILRADAPATAVAPATAAPDPAPHQATAG